eukprot:TRINITY_DN29766_c0_g1_i1.p1 TRINITY_DN29766_c0_g1~~TRINITY_DN29766_c0_g1_i1.p1  ORF type:complete len:999 (+),score=318.28 TRINITY_DN29766_c0_g1_i1:84-3080(+)
MGFVGAGASRRELLKKSCLGVTFAMVAFVLLSEDEVSGTSKDSAPPAVVPNYIGAASSEITTHLLASLGLLEYAGMLERLNMRTVKSVAAQPVHVVPPGVKPFHWKMMVYEAKKIVPRGLNAPHGGLAAGAAADAEDDDPVPKPVVVLKDAPEDTQPLEMPKTRTIGECRVTRSFIPPEKEDDPPLFWSFPGSGNTWIRFLIEQATGYYTGSVYRDLDIIKVMPGELRCDRSVVAVKGHPNWTPFDLVDGAYRDGSRWSKLKENGRDWIPNTEYWYGIAGIKETPTIRGFYKKCADVQIKRALVVIRDPFAALWAEYQRVKAEKIVNGTKDYGHVAKLEKKDFVPGDMRRHLISLMQDWVLQFVGYEGFIERNGCDAVMFQPFEELINPVTRSQALTRIAAHLRKPLVTSPECAFTLADHPAIRREKYTDPTIMTMSDAYNHPDVGDLVCDMYEIAGPELDILGYKPPKMGPRKGKCARPKRANPVLSKHMIYTGGTLNCKSDRVKGMSSPKYHLVPDVYDNKTAPKEIVTEPFLDQPPAATLLPKSSEKTEDGLVDSTYEDPDFERPYLTLACAGRNDNHSGDIMARTQNQITNLAAYAERYQVPIEVIVVEWNPEEDRPPIGNVLKLPNTTSGKFISVRVIQVTKALHEVVVPPPIHLPVQQYVGKNVAVRRARGEFVLAWNADMLLNGAFFERVKRRDFKKGIYYRIDRIDFDKPFPDGFDIGNLEAEKEAAWIEMHAYQVRTAVGTRTLATPSDKATFWHDFHVNNDTTDRFAKRCCEQQCDRQFKSCRWVKWSEWSGDQIRAEVPKLEARGEIQEVEDLLNVPQQFHANAPGDFLMMSRDDWMKLRGYPEAPYQDEIDKYIMAEAFAAGMDQEIMPPPVTSFHQYHSGSWGSAGGLTEDMALRPSLGQRKYIEDGRDMLLKKKPVTLWNDANELGCNNAQWGLGNIALYEMMVQPQKINTTRSSLRVIRQPFDQMEHVVAPGCGWTYKKPEGK